MTTGPGRLSFPFAFPLDKSVRDPSLVKAFTRTKDAINALIANLNQFVLITSPAQITANQDNYNPGTFGWLRLTTDASRNITGFTGGHESRELWITNVGAFNIVLVEQATSTAANQIITGTGADITLVPLDTALLKYDSVSPRWRVVSHY